jgi:hypothetical protein
MRTTFALQGVRPQGEETADIMSKTLQLLFIVRLLWSVVSALCEHVSRLQWWPRMQEKSLTNAQEFDVFPRKEGQ